MLATPPITRRELDMTNIDPAVFYGEENQAALKARYEAVHADIMLTGYAQLQADIDSGYVWTLKGDGVRAYLFQALGMGAVVAPPVSYPDDGDGRRVPAYWEMAGVGLGTVELAEKYIAAVKAEYEELSKLGEFLPVDEE
jgi:hypothetical protein